MTTRHRVILLVLAASGAYVGAWGLADPHSFFASFPGLGRHWTATDGPYNEHLVRDVAAFYAAFCVLSVIAAVRPERLLVVATGIAWEVFSVPHLVYHAFHLDTLPRVDQVGELASLAATVALAALLLLPSRAPDRSAA